MSEQLILIANSGAPSGRRVRGEAGYPGEETIYVFDEINTIADAYRHSGIVPLYTDVVWVFLPGDLDVMDYFSVRVGNRG